MCFKKLNASIPLMVALLVAQNALATPGRDPEQSPTAMGFIGGQFEPSKMVQAAGSPIAGTWEGRMDNLPVITITIRDDSAKLSGSVTFYRIQDDGNGPTVAGKETREMIDPRLDGKILYYQIKGRNDELVSRQMELTGKDEGIVKLIRRINGNTEEVPVKMTRSTERGDQRTSVQGAPGAGPEGKTTQQETLRSIEAMLEDVANKDEFSGVVLVANDGKPVFQKAIGLASKEYNVPNRLETRFNLGSINKVFTQILIGQLAAEGKLSYDDHMDKYLPDYPNREAADKITIHQLLNMTSGIGDFFGPEFQATPKDRIRNLRDYLPLFAKTPLAFPPGTRSQYSNGGYVVLGLIIEKITGRSYYDVARERILRPTSMENTGYFEADRPVSNIASGYTRNSGDGEKQWRNNIYTRPARGSSAGGGYSTAEDLLRFANALHVRKLAIPNFEAGSPGDASPLRDPDGLGIAGGAPGINSTLDTGVAGHYTVIVMSNYDPPSAINVARQIRRLLSQV